MMFPSLRTRLLITIAAIAGSMLWVSAAEAAMAPDGSGGISLITAGSFGKATAMILLAGLPALIMGLVISALGNPLSGLFAAAIGLCSLAVTGGEMNGWIDRTNAGLPGDYLKLAMETLLWFAAVIVFLIVAMKLRPSIRKTIPKLVDKHHFGSNTQLRKFNASAWTAGGITALVGGILSFLLLRTAESGQVVGGLILAFMIAAFVGMLVAGSIFGELRRDSDTDQGEGQDKGSKIERLVAPPRNPIPVLLAPAVVAIIGYLLTMVAFSDKADLLASWYSGGVLGIARALPIHYASAGIIGCCLGIGWAQAVAGDSSSHEEETGNSAAIAEA